MASNGISEYTVVTMGQKEIQETGRWPPKGLHMAHKGRKKRFTNILTLIERKVTFLTSLKRCWLEKLCDGRLSGTVL